jgi:hypothetical protein
MKKILLLATALGSSNPDHPYTLVPVTVDGNTATTGDPIPMPAVNYADLASCNAGPPLALDEISASQSFTIYPNPAINKITIETPGISSNFQFPFSTPAARK